MKKIVLPSETIIQIVHEYGSGISILQIHKKFGLGMHLIRGALVDFGIEIVQNRERYGSNKIFEENSEFFYWLGYIAADGCITKNYVTVTSKDIDILEKFKKFSESRNLIRSFINKSGYATGNSHHVFGFSSVDFLTRLKKYGITERKTHTLDIKTHLMNEEQQKNFWRGMIDGDGWVSFNPNTSVLTLGLVGSKLIIDSFNQYIGERFKTSALVKPHYSIFKMTYNKQLAMDILFHLYEGSTLYLDRKYAKYILARDNWKVYSRHKPLIGIDVQGNSILCFDTTQEVAIYFSTTIKGIIGRIYRGGFTKGIKLVRLQKELETKLTLD